MDFGIIYMQNKAATNAAMWLGFVIFSLFIFVPFLIWWLSIPLYVTLLVIGATKNFKLRIKYSRFYFRLPHLRQHVSCVLHFGGAYHLSSI